MISENEWNEINKAIAVDGNGKPTGLHYAPEMRCEHCGKMVSRNNMYWVRVRTYNGGASEKWCGNCYNN